MKEVFSFCFDFWEAITMFFHISAGFFKKEYLSVSISGPKLTKNPKKKKCLRSDVTWRHMAEIWLKFQKMFLPLILLLGASMKLIAWIKRKCWAILYFKDLYEIYREFGGWFWDMTNILCSTWGIPTKIGKNVSKGWIQKVAKFGDRRRSPSEAI